jgi:hypothetical protein
MPEINQHQAYKAVHSPTKEMHAAPVSKSELSNALSGYIPDAPPDSEGPTEAGGLSSTPVIAESKEAAETKAWGEHFNRARIQHQAKMEMDCNAVSTIGNVSRCLRLIYIAIDRLPATNG